MNTVHKFYEKEESPSIFTLFRTALSELKKSVVKIKNWPHLHQDSIKIDTVLWEIQSLLSILWEIENENFMDDEVFIWFSSKIKEIKDSIDEIHINNQELIKIKQTLHDALYTIEWETKIREEAASKKSHITQSNVVSILSKKVGDGKFVWSFAGVLIKNDQDNGSNVYRGAFDEVYSAYAERAEKLRNGDTEKMRKLLERLPANDSQYAENIKILNLAEAANEISFHQSWIQNWLEKSETHANELELSQWVQIAIKSHDYHSFTIKNLRKRWSNGMCTIDAEYKINREDANRENKSFLVRIDSLENGKNLTLIDPERKNPPLYINIGDIEVQSKSPNQNREKPEEKKTIFGGLKTAMSNMNGKVKEWWKRSMF